MFTIFQNIKEGIRVDGRVLTSLWRLEDLSHFNLAAEPVQTKRRAISLLSSVSPCSMFSFDYERGKDI